MRLVSGKTGRPWNTLLSRATRRLKRLSVRKVPEPGDFAVVNTGSRLTTAIEVMEFISGRGKAEFDHAVICSRVLSNGTVMIVEAQPAGAVEVPWHYEARPHKWSTGILPSCPAAGPAAQRYAGVDYSFLDYWAIAAHSWHIPAPGLKAYIGATGHMICSQLVDQARLDGGSHLFTDNRWPGYVEPMDLAHLL